MILPKHINGAKGTSFANFTIRSRFPAVINEILENNNLNESQSFELKKILLESQNGLIKNSIPLEKEELPFWNDFFNEFNDKSYFEVPFFMVEAYFYRKIIEVFKTTDQRIYDPFEHKKLKNLDENKNYISQLALEGLPKSIQEYFQFILWGNKADLSQFSNYQTENNRGFQLIQDHSESLSAYFQFNHPLKQMNYVADNAGVELITDILFIHYLLSENLVSQLSLHLKKLPMLVSDATIQDFEQHINFMHSIPGLNHIVKTIRLFITSGRLVVMDNYYWNSPMHFTSLAENILEQFTESDLVIFKGDANYRRLYEDREWDFSTEPSKASSFPFSYAAFRILKSEIVLGLTNNVIKGTGSSKDWLTNGSVGMIYFHEKSPKKA